MTSFRQIEANRRNALKSTGPTSTEGKRRSRCNAVRHGLTAETVIGALEDAEDYKAFEAAIIADYDAQTAVERELVLRLASVLWRLRRATMMETGLFEFEAGHVLESELAYKTEQERRKSLYALFRQTTATNANGVPGQLSNSLEAGNGCEHTTSFNTDLARCFLRVADLPSHALDRLCRYEALLWRQARQIVFVLDGLGRRRPRKAGRSFQFHNTRNSPLEEHEEG